MLTICSFLEPHEPLYRKGLSQCLDYGEHLRCLSHCPDSAEEEGTPRPQALLALPGRFSLCIEK